MKCHEKSSSGGLYSAMKKLPTWHITCQYVPRLYQYDEGGDALEQDTVLVVDDDESIRESLRFFLEDEGYVVVTAHDGLAAMGIIPTLAGPTVILLDLVMPRLDGYGVLRELADHPEQRDTHSIFLMTANRDRLTPAVVQLLGSLGIPVLPKPFDVEQLKEQIWSAFARLREQHEH
jgi:two-component system, OmpR family, alkaline phosphatase synthesis response regulator PhoP